MSFYAKSATFLKRPVWLISAVLLLAAFVAGIRIFYLPEEVRVRYPKLQPVKQEVFGVGTVEARVMVNVAGKVSGRISRVLVDQGDLVAAGQTVAILEQTDFEEEVNRSQAVYERAKLILAADEASLQSALSKLEQLKATQRKAAAEYELAAKNAERYEFLLRQGVVSQLDKDLRDNELKTKQEEISRLKAEEAALLAEITRARRVVEASRKEIEAGNATLKLAQTRRDDMVIVSPINGIVISREREAGDVVSAGIPVFRIADPADIWTLVYVDETAAAGLSLGQPAEIRLRSQPKQPLVGHVARIERESDRVTEERRVNVAFKRIPLEIYLGEQVDVLIAVRESPEALTLPEQAVLNGDAGWGVWIVKDGRLEWRAVTLGIRDRQGLIEIKGGMSLQDAVVMEPPERTAAFQTGERAAIR